MTFKKFLGLLSPKQDVEVALYSSKCGLIGTTNGRADDIAEAYKKDTMKSQVIGVSCEDDILYIEIMEE